MRWLINGLGLVGCAVVASLGLLFWMISGSIEQAERTKAEFVAACDAVHGTAVWNRKHWECLK